MLRSEMDGHLGYNKHEIAGYNMGNSRNGSLNKSIHTENVGDVLLNILRDKNGDLSQL
jgi:putative transposase